MTEGGQLAVLTVWNMGVRVWLIPAVLWQRSFLMWPLTSADLINTHFVIL